MDEDGTSVRLFFYFTTAYKDLRDIYFIGIPLSICPTVFLVALSIFLVSATNGSMWMKISTVVYNLRMIKEDNLGLTNIKGDSSREIVQGR